MRFGDEEIGFTTGAGKYAGGADMWKKPRALRGGGCPKNMVAMSGKEVQPQRHPEIMTLGYQGGIRCPMPTDLER